MKTMLLDAMAPESQEGRFSSQPVGYLFGRFGLLIILAGLLVAAWYGQLVIVVLLALALSTVGLSKLWSRLSLVGVSCQRQLSEQRAFPGESIELKLELANRKLLPLPWVQVDDEIPLKLSSGTRLAASNRPGSGLLAKSAALLWYTRVSWKERLCCDRRGYYQLGPVTLTSGDIFGFYPRSVIEPLVDHVIVYPKVFPISELGIPSTHPLGETVAEQRIFEDPIRVVGVRDYSPRDSHRHIHWKATARRNELQVKVFEPTTTLKGAIFLAVDSFAPGQGEVLPEEHLELGISTAASVASYLTEQRSAVGLFVNSKLADSGQPCTLTPGSGTDQLVEMLEALAKVTPQSSGPFEEFLQTQRPSLSWGTTLVFIVYRPSPSLKELFVGLKEKGHKVQVLQIGQSGDSGPAPEGVDWYHISQPGDFVKVGVEEMV